MIIKHKKQLFLFEPRKTKRGEEVELRLYQDNNDYHYFIIPYWAWEQLKGGLIKAVQEGLINSKQAKSETNPTT